MQTGPILNKKHLALLLTILPPIWTLFFLGWGMLDYPFAVCLSIGLILFVIWLACGIYLISIISRENKEEKPSLQKRDEGKPCEGINIVVDSRDFVGMDAKHAKVVFDGLARIIREERRHGGKTEDAETEENNKA